MNLIDKLKNKIIKKTVGVSSAEALDLFIEASNHPWVVMAAASEIREHFKGKEIILCGITNAKSGRCPEDCKFCAQSSHYQTATPSYPLKTAKQIITEAGGGQKTELNFSASLPAASA